MTMYKAVVLEVGKDPKVVELENSYESVVDIVGGYLEVVRLKNDIDMWINEEGKLKGLPLNFSITRNQVVLEEIVGNVVFLSSDSEGDTVSLNEDQIKYIAHCFGDRMDFIV